MRTFATLSVLAACNTIASAQLNLGSFEGQWDNNTFGSSGGAFMLVESLGGADVQITVDLDGFVFGQGDPDPFVITGSVGATGFVADAFDHPTFGEMSGGVDELGNVEIDLENAGNGAFTLVTLRGTAVGDSVQLDYTIFSPSVPGGPFAVGEINMRRVPTPGSAVLLGIGGLIAVRRKRSEKH